MILALCTIYFGFLLLTSGVVFLLKILAPFMVFASTSNDPWIIVYGMTRFLNHFSVGNSMRPMIEVFFELTYSCLSLTFYLCYVVLITCVTTMGLVMNIAIKILPFVWKTFKFLFSFVSWTLYQIFQGIFGVDNQFLRFISWIAVACSAFLYVENRLNRRHVRRRPGDHGNQIPQQNYRQQNRDNNNRVNNNQEGAAENQITEGQMGNVNEDLNQNVQINNDVPIPYENSGNINVVPNDADLLAGGLHFYGNENHTYRRLHRNNDDIRVRNIQNDQNRQNNETTHNGDTRPRNVHSQIRNLAPLHQIAREENEINEAIDENEVNRTYERARRESQSPDQENNNRRIRDQGNVMDNDQLFCIICMEQERNAVVFPCGHTQFCQECVFMIARRTQTCPVCQSFIQEHRRIYI